MRILIVLLFILSSEQLVFAYDEGYLTSEKKLQRYEQLVDEVVNWEGYEHGKFEAKLEELIGLEDQIYNLLTSQGVSFSWPEPVSEKKLEVDDLGDGKKRYKSNESDADKIANRNAFRMVIDALTHSLDSDGEKIDSRRNKIEDYGKIMNAALIKHGPDGNANRLSSLYSIWKLAKNKLFESVKVSLGIVSSAAITFRRPDDNAPGSSVISLSFIYDPTGFSDRVVVQKGVRSIDGKKAETLRESTIMPQNDSVGPQDMATAER